MYIKLSTLEFPRYEGDIRIEHPEITEEQTGPSFPCPDTYAPVRRVAVPEYNPETQAPLMNPPIKDDFGNWTMSWTVVNLTPEEIENRRIFTETMRARSRENGLNQ